MTNNPLKNLVNINDLQQKAEVDKLGQIQREARQFNKQNKTRKVFITRGEKCELEFDSKFESGNLAAAIYTDEDEFDLILQNDTNTQGYTQWFFFKIKHNGPYAKEFTFSLVNHVKSDSLFNYGMKVLSSIEQPEGGFAWRRTCTEISYEQNNFKREVTAESRFFYSLRFTT